MKLYMISLLLLSVIITLANCGDSTCKKESPYTMAVDSELTLLMREMYTYYDSIRLGVADGLVDEDIRVFHDVHKAVATSPEKSSSDLYQALSTIYIQSAERLNTPNIDKQQAFNLMVDNCMNCHKQMCPGPMVRIKKLYLKED